MFRGTKKLLNITILNILFSIMYTPLSAQEKSSVEAIDKKLESIKRKYRKSDMTDATAWQELSKLQRSLPVGEGSKSNIIADLFQTQAYILDKGKYPLLSARYASMAIESATEPFAKSMLPSWQLLDQIAQERQIHDVLIILAAKLLNEESLPPVFAKNWYYFKGEAYLLAKDTDKAIACFEKLGLKDRFYHAARYQMAMTYLREKNDLNKSGLILKGLVNEDVKAVYTIDEKTRNQYVDLANLALGRIQYERQKFISSAKYYRKVRRSSIYYYNALFEQAWAFFLAGYPNHALGALHAVDSPYFPNRFNPETSILRSIVYYWMCRYDDSKTSLAEFIEKYSDPVNNLDAWLEQKSLNDRRSFQLFENLVSGVSSQSLGIERKLLDSVAITPPMIIARDRLSTVLKESERLKVRGIFKSKKETKFAEKVLDTWLEELTSELGRVYVAELEDLRNEYKNFRSQANFIYIELLMSEKEHVLGKELHADQKLDKVNLSKHAKGWGQGNMPWRASDKGEYWWDEVGFFVYQVKPRCNSLDEVATKE